MVLTFLRTMSQTSPTLLRETESELESWRSTGNRDVLPIQTEKRIRTLLEQAMGDMGPLRKTLQDLEQQVKREEIRIQTLRTAISPMKRVPSEIIAEIFIQCGENVLLPRTSNSYPWVLGHVCRRWRQILWRSSLIWRSIHIRPLPRIMFDRIISFQESLEYTISQTDALLSLSADEDTGLWIRVIVIAHHHRFRHLELCGIDTDDFFSFVRHSPASFSNLETLFVILYPRPAHLAPFPFQIARNLRKLCCRSTISLQPSFRIQLLSLPPWTQLTDISMHDIYLLSSTVHATLQRCPGLVSCAVLLTADAIIQNNNLVALPSLKTLKVRTTDIVDWDSFLHKFAFPALTDLH